MMQSTTALVEDKAEFKIEPTKFYQKIKPVLAELIDLKTEGVEAFAVIIENDLPGLWKNSELGQFLYDLKNRHLILLKPNYHAKEQHRVQVYECLQRLLITLNDILKVSGHEKDLFQRFKAEVQTEILTLDSLRNRFTYTGGDQNFALLLDTIEKTASRYEGSIEREKKKDSHHDELQQLKKLIAARQHSLLGDWQDLQEKTKSANEREKFLHRRCSQLSQRYSIVLENLVNNLVEYKINPSSGLSKELQSLIDDGLLSAEMIQLCGKAEQQDLPKWSKGLSEVLPEGKQQHVHYTRVSDWLSIELRNSLETPFRKAVYQTLIFYHQLMRRLLSNLEFQEVHMNEDLMEFKQCTELRQQIATLRKITFFTTAYEQALGKGRSISSAQGIREYTKLSALLKNKQLALQTEFETLGWGTHFKKHVDTLNKNLKQLMVVRYQVKNLLLKITKYLDQKFPTLAQKATDHYEPQSITYRLQQLLLEAKHSIEAKGSDATFLPILNPGEANVSLKLLSDGVSKLEKYFPIFKRPLGSIRQSNTKAIPLEEWYKNDSELSLEKKLIDLEDQLRSYQLKSRETRILTLPTEGPGTYDPYTNTIIVPQICRNENPVEGLYRAIATYLYRSRIKNDTSAHKELVDVLSLRHSIVKKRQHCERIIVNAFCKHLMEVTGIIHTSGHTQKEKKVISSHLDHPNHLIQCREIINIPIQKREAFLGSIMESLGLKKLEHIGEQIIRHFEDPDLAELNSELEPQERFQSIFDNLDSDQRLQLTEKLFDLGVIQFHKHHLESSLECFVILQTLSPDCQEVWWNVATILNYHAFDGYVNIVRDRKKTALEAYKRFSKTEGVSEYWIRKARSLSQELELKHF